jgi:hypothetical protein
VVVPQWVDTYDFAVRTEILGIGLNGSGYKTQPQDAAAVERRGARAQAGPGDYGRGSPKHARQGAGACLGLPGRASGAWEGLCRALHPRHVVLREGGRENRAEGFSSGGIGNQRGKGGASVLTVGAGLFAIGHCNVPRVILFPC